MSSTYLSFYYHFVFSTKNREPLIAGSWRPGLHKYLAGVVEGLGGHCEIAGGTDDHVHLLVQIGTTRAVADFMRELKKSSSTWARKDAGSKVFAWQEGYAGFTVSASGVDEVRQYIENQEEHHRKRSFREELILMLKLSGVKYDERYLD